MNRRDFVRTMCLGGLATFGWPTVSFAQVRQKGRLVFVLLRGGFDGLAAIVPYGDPAYESLRGGFAFEESELVTLNDTFGLAPGLAPLRDLWERGELAAIHAMAIPFRTRSHFDGQAILETDKFGDRVIGDTLFIALNADPGRVSFTLPSTDSIPFHAPQAGSYQWELVVDTAQPDAESRTYAPGAQVEMTERSSAIFKLK